MTEILRATAMSGRHGSSTIPAALLLNGLLIGVSAILIVATPKRSFLRYLWLPIGALISIEVYNLSAYFTTSSIRNSKSSVFGLVSAIHTLNLLIINPLDRGELQRNKICHASSSFVSCVWKTVCLLGGSRGLNTPWQAKNTPSHPAFYAYQTGMDRSNPSCGLFLLRQALICAWQFLALDIMYIASLQVAPKGNSSQEFKYWDISWQEWVNRLATSLFTTFLAARTLVDTAYRCGSLVAVALGFSLPAEWPPLFGSLRDAYTVRGYWGSVISSFSPSSAFDDL
jgi:hypothetical protein